MESPWSRRWAPAASTYCVRLIAIGSSTGGPGALNIIFSQLPAKFPVPIVVAQHMTPGFIGGMAEWLAVSSANPVKVAENGELLRSGNVYIAPDGVHMGVGHDGKIVLQEGPEIDGARPSVNHLLTTVADCYGPMAIAVLLTGMGSDGVAGLSRIKSMGGRTIVQDESTSVVFGMPQQAIQVGAADRVLRLDEIPGALVEALA
jgi:two-component system chemotaxis response regulator CheB